MEFMTETILEVRNIVKLYRQGLFNRKETFRLEANFTIPTSTVIGVMGPNGSGKTTIFELITGLNQPSSGSVLILGKNIHNVKYSDRYRLAMHYHQSYQVRRFRRTKPSFLLSPVSRKDPIIHLFDEPQFNIQDGYIGFMLDFFRKLRTQGKLIFVCLHPNEPYHIELMREICEQFLFVLNGKVYQFPSFDSMLQMHEFEAYLGKLAPNSSEAND